MLRELKYFTADEQFVRAALEYYLSIHQIIREKDKLQ